MKDKIKKNVSEVVNMTAEGIEKAAHTIVEINKQGTGKAREIIGKGTELAEAVTKPVQDVVVNTAKSLKVPDVMVSTPIEVAQKVREAAKEGAIKTLETVDMALDLGARQVETVTQMARTVASDQKKD